MLSLEEFLGNLKKYENVFFVDAGDKILKFTVDEVSKTSEIKEPPKIDKETTIVTGLWNLGRGDLNDNGFKRSYEDYRNRFVELMRSPANMFIYVSKEDEEFVWQHRSKNNTFVKVMELEEFKSWFEFFDKVQEIRNKTEWHNQAGWLAESPQAKLEYYNPLVMSKMFLLNNASIFNPFDSNYFYWIDAGITNTVHAGYFYHDNVFANLSEVAKKTNGMMFISYPYEGGTEIHGFQRDEMAKYCNTDYVNYVCRGGFFGGSKEIINNINGIYHGFLSDSLSKGLMGTEESIFTIIAHRYPELVTRFSIGGDGLIWPFFEKLKDPLEFIKSIPKIITHHTAQNILYILGFNSPQQFESTCESIKLADIAMFERSRKILINNSTDTSLFDEYDRLCELYNFEEIHRENLGVCGGRQFAAEHFDTTDADFYMFFEDDMHLNNKETVGQFCRNGFRKYVPKLYEKVIKIMIREKLDFLKFSFSEFYGDNSVQWSWYNVPQNVRTEIWPDYDKLPELGLDPNAPKTEFSTVSIIDEIPYIKGEIYYSNWPQIISREGNKKMFLSTKWSHPFEQTWMSHMFQLTRKKELSAAVLLASPVEHDRFEFYDGSLRKES